MKRERKPVFDPKAFLATAADDGKTISKYSNCLHSGRGGGCRFLYSARQSEDYRCFRARERSDRLQRSRELGRGCSRRRRFGRGHCSRHCFQHRGRTADRGSRGSSWRRLGWPHNQWAEGKAPALGMTPPHAIGMGWAAQSGPFLFCGHAARPYSRQK
jgi:hypothetical protein